MFTVFLRSSKEKTCKIRFTSFVLFTSLVQFTSFVHFTSFVLFTSFVQFTSFVHFTSLVHFTSFVRGPEDFGSCGQEDIFTSDTLRLFYRFSNIFHANQSIQIQDHTLFYYCESIQVIL